MRRNEALSLKFACQTIHSTTQESDRKFTQLLIRQIIKVTTVVRDVILGARSPSEDDVRKDGAVGFLLPESTTVTAVAAMLLTQKLLFQSSFCFDAKSMPHRC